MDYNYFTIGIEIVFIKYRMQTGILLSILKIII